MIGKCLDTSEFIHIKKIPSVYQGKDILPLVGVSLCTRSTQRTDSYSLGKDLSELALWKKNYRLKENIAFSFQVLISLFEEVQL